MNADYRGQLVARAVDLVQLFPAAAYGKNGADIRLAVDTVEDMFRLPDLTHVVIVAGDSDYIALAQRCKRLAATSSASGWRDRRVGRWPRRATTSSSTTRCPGFRCSNRSPAPPEKAAPKRATRGRVSAGRPTRRARRPRPASRSDGVAAAGAPDRVGEGRRRLAAQLAGEGSDEADGPVVQREVVRFKSFSDFLRSRTDASSSTKARRRGWCG